MNDVRSYGHHLYWELSSDFLNIAIS